MACLLVFFNWCSAVGVVVPRTTEEFDFTLMNYAECLWAEGDSLSQLSYLLSALHHYVKNLKHRLNGAWKMHSTWRREEPSRKAAPFTTLMAQALAGYFVHAGLLDVAIVLLLAFTCMLRAGEFMSVLAGDFAVGNHVVIITLKDTKIGSRTGAVEQTSTSEKWLVPRLKLLLSQRAPGDRLMSMPPHRFRKLFNEGRKAIGLPASYSPYSLRRGGATALFRQTGSYNIVSTKGRWSTEKAMRGYINTALQSLSQEGHGHDKALLTAYANKLHCLKGR